MTVYLDESVQSYLYWLKEIKHAPYHTFRSYQVDLIQFLKYFLKNESNEFPSKESILEYINLIKGKYNYSSYRRKVTAIRNFISYLIDSGINIPDPLISISLPNPEVQYDIPMTYEDVLELIHAMPEGSTLEIRDKLIFSLIAKCGLTVKQLVSLKIKDINLASNQIILSSEQLTFFDTQTNSLLERYIYRSKSKLNLGLDDYLLANTEKIPLSTRSITLVIDRVSKRLRANCRLSPTVLRRLFAKKLNEEKVNKSTIEMILGKNSRLTLSPPKLDLNKNAIESPEELNI